MSKEKDHLKDLSEIRSLMEKSTTFISLSGISGILAGTCALLGAGVAYQRLHTNTLYQESYQSETTQTILDMNGSNATEFIVIAIAVLFSALFFGSIFTIRKAKKQGQSLWDKTSQRLFTNMAIPLVTGGLFCLLLINNHSYALIAPATLIFYGLALVNASKYTLKDIRFLGVTEIILGLLAVYFIGNGLLFWTIGFGILHIIYGSIMYFKYDK